MPGAFDRGTVLDEKYVKHIFNPVSALVDVLDNTLKTKENFAPPPGLISIPEDLLTFRMDMRRGNITKYSNEKQYRIKYRDFDIKSLYRTEKAVSTTIHSMTKLTNINQVLTGDYYIYLPGDPYEKMPSNRLMITSTSCYFFTDMSIPKELQIEFNNGEVLENVAFTIAPPNHSYFTAARIYNVDITAVETERLRYLGLSDYVDLVDKIFDASSGEEMPQPIVVTTDYVKDSMISSDDNPNDHWYLNISVALADTSSWARKYLTLNYGTDQNVYTRGYMLPLAFFTRDE